MNARLMIKVTHMQVLTRVWNCNEMDGAIVVGDVDDGDDDGGRCRGLQDHNYGGDGNPLVDPPLVLWISFWM
jgi:hypothetical protein